MVSPCSSWYFTRLTKQETIPEPLQKVLWTHDKANVQQLFELTQEHRCVDPWLSATLHAARHGALTQEQWAFLGPPLPRLCARAAGHRAPSFHQQTRHVPIGPSGPRLLLGRKLGF